MAPADDLLRASGTLLRAWAARWTEAPGRPLWREPGGSWWTAGAFDGATRRVAGRLAGAGLRPGDRMVWSTGSSVAALVAHVGALRAGLVVVPASTAYGRRELEHVVREVSPAVAVVDRSVHAGWLAAAPSGAPPLVLTPDVDLPDAPVPDHLDRADPTDAALIGFTSGTTGAPKGAVLRHANLLAGAEALRLAWRWSPDDRLVHCLPVFHAHGLCVGVYGTLLAGASAVLLPGFDPSAVLDEVAAPGATLLFGVPTMYHRLVGSDRAAALGSLRLCVSGSAPLPASLHHAVSAAAGTPVLERYGMTETLMIASNPYDGERRPGSVGFPLPGVDLRLAGDGEIQVRRPAVFDGYLGRPAADADSFVDDPSGRWFRTGDLGTDDGGVLVIHGRAKELIISGGFNVYPAEVEDVLLGHPAVAEVAVTGTPSEEWGEVVTAWVVADGRAPTSEELAGYCGPLLAPYKRPRILHVVESLPRNALGKVERGRLGR